MRMMAVAAVLLAGLTVAMPTDAARVSRAAIQRQSESSLRVSGSITVGTDGAVLAHTLDRKAVLGDDLAAFIGKNVTAWRFKPILVDGKAVAAKVPMHLRLVAQPMDGGRLSVSIASTYFGNRDVVPGTDQLRSARLTPPRYPKTAMYMGGRGTVYLIVQVDREGKVSNVDAEQVNLRVAGTANQMELLRKQFAQAAIRAARDWRFEIPTTGEEVDESHWLARVPVDFRLGGLDDDDVDGSKWETYIPGPRNLGMPWAQEMLKTAGSPEALPDNSITPLRQGATLLTPLGT